MKNDARFLINQKRLKKPNLNKTISRGVVDARKILNSRLGKKSNFTTPRTSGSGQRFFSKFKRSVPTKSSFPKSPEKQIELTRDGNIFITAKSKDTIASGSRNIYSSSNISPIKPKPRWVPADVETADLEHVGIEDVLDMDTLPSAFVGPTNVKNIQNRSIPRTLAQEIVEMGNTMVADQITSPSHTAASISVSNLHSSVSREDIMELFGDVGLIKHAEMRQPGMAIVEYFDSSDAIKACDLYHNRLLDGQPMQCFIQPHTSQRSLLSQRLGARVPTSARSASTSFSLVNSRAVYNPKNVRFTVKLT